ncbi:uncharacterized protein with GYD domain [Roseiarcus fermentans]|uniref:Uncharacterized protein with GYD domain n=1 Tax=Roseiarcus fermentans TaxID=1473586 RepID=A0A366F3E3_9HYPH|nr:GYD domain-containing protein [Roseiarcus fermentans]RBP09114.1 uncharacterized protein with GYD domain [Roseiarcus fermentans]
MPYYMFQWKYKNEAVKALVQTPQDRAAELRKVVQAFGGRLHEFFFAFGDYDGVSIVEFPNNERCAACATTLTGAGANDLFRTTVLLTGDEAKAALAMANATNPDYAPPTGYTHHS